MRPKRKKRANPKLKEAIAGAVSLMKHKPDFEDDALFTALKQLKPRISDSDLVIAIARAKEGLFKPEYFSDELKQEMDEWDRIE
ncbi:MAG: hypothetical protein ACPLKZ_02440 [Candidatus Bathyarchaeales archaeon]